jgi:hypothetical protein
MNRLQLWALRATAAFALIWSVFRALRQAITLDEADTYLWFASREPSFIWYPFPNNHLFNSLLMWLSTHAFGVSPLTVRLPALLGAALYIWVAYFICRAITGRFALQLATLIALVYNPFVLDFFAAARGYSLANAFLLAALAIPLWNKSVPLASTAIGLSFASNFSFGFVDGAALLAILSWAIRRRGPTPVLRVITDATLPALAVVIVMCGYPIAHYPRQELWYGAQSLAEMARSLVDASLYHLPAPLEFFKPAGPYLLLALAALCACRLVLTRPFRATGMAGILILTVAAHALAFRVFKLPLPMTRTGIFFLPLCTLLIAFVAAAPADSRFTRGLGHAITAMLLCLGAHYLLCLRYTYFGEYEKAAEMRAVYRVIERLNRDYGFQEFTADGAYRSPLNFYRAMSQCDHFPPLAGYEGTLPPGKRVYILHASFYRRFIEENRLAIVYRGRISQVVVAVAPG